MDTTASHGTLPPLRARLLIHLSTDGEPPSRSWIDATIQAFRRRMLGHPMRRPARSLRVDDAGGHHVFAIDDAADLTHLELTPGTYQVTASCGTHCRLYTMTLVGGAALDLLVRFAPGM